jgi:AcrR family transcriptional regulator
VRKARKVSTTVQVTREERAARTREQLLMSTARVVGEFGYRDASIQRITADAGMAQGTFYLYFESRQALFDELLPHFGLHMLERVRERAHGAKGFFEVEEIGVRAVFEYLYDNPWFWRVLNEAEVEAPTAWARHHSEVTRRYTKFLQRAQAEGEITAYAESELGTLAYLLIAARDYLYVYHLAKADRSTEIPDAVIKTYLRFLRNGLGGPAAVAPVPRTEKPAASATRTRRRSAD